MFMFPQYPGGGVPGLPAGYTTTPGGIPTGAVYQDISVSRMKGEPAVRSAPQPIYYNPQPVAAPPPPPPQQQQNAPAPQPAAAPPPPPPASSSSAAAGAPPEIVKARDLERRSEHEFDRAYASVPKLQFGQYQPQERMDGDSEGGSSYAKAKNNANLATSALLDYAKNVEDFSRHAAEGFRMKALATEERSRDTDNRVISGLQADLGPNPLDVAREENAKAQKRQDDLFLQSQHQQNLSHIARMMQLAASAR